MLGNIVDIKEGRGEFFWGCLCLDTRIERLCDIIILINDNFILNLYNRGRL